MHANTERPAAGQARAHRASVPYGRDGRRLSELGFLPGSEIACLLVSPLGDPRAYQICDTLIALRGRDARHIELDEFPEKGVNAP